MHTLVQSIVAIGVRERATTRAAGQVAPVVPAEAGLPQIAARQVAVLVVGEERVAAVAGNLVGRVVLHNRAVQVRQVAGEVVATGIASGGRAGADLTGQPVQGVVVIGVRAAVRFSHAGQIAHRASWTAPLIMAWLAVLICGTDHANRKQLNIVAESGISSIIMYNVPE